MPKTFAPQTHKVQLYSDSFAVREALLTMRDAWKSAGVTEDLCNTSELILAEVLNNVVEHAHEEDPEGNIEVESEVTPAEIRIAVRDDGRAMPRESLPEGTLADLPNTVDDLPEGGFGWFMVHALAKRIEYQHKDGWNCLRYCVEL